MGAVTFKASGGLERRPSTRSSSADSIHLSFFGTTDNGGSIGYSIDAKPKK